MTPADDRDKLEMNGGVEAFSSRCERRWHRRPDLPESGRQAVGEPGRFLQQSERQCHGPEAGLGLGKRSAWAAGSGRRGGWACGWAGDQRGRPREGSGVSGKLASILSGGGEASGLRTLRNVMA